MSYRVIGILAAIASLAGCASCPPPIEVPTFIPVPAGCLEECSYTGPTEIRVNGDLLEAFKAREAQAACLESRLACVRGVQP
jgi:hypothetical protein